MSRSRRHTPVTANTYARSEKKDKQLANRRFRQRERATLFTRPPRKSCEVSEVWAFGKDGKNRFDPEKYSKLMRK